jgi:hypothetical protein
LSNRKARLTRRQRHYYSQILRASAERKPRTGEMGELGCYPPCGFGRPGSSLAWAAWEFARQWGGRADVDVGKLLRVVLTWGSGECVYRFARDVPGANVRRCQRAVMDG